MIGALLQRTALRQWRAITGVFFTSTLLEFLAVGHLDAFTPLFLRDELHLAPDQVGPWTGLLTTATFAIAFPLAPLWGSLAERYSRKAVIVRSQYLEAIGYVLVAFAPDLSWLVAARLILGFTYGNIAVITATQTLLTPDRRMASSISIVQSAMPIALSFGPPLGAFLLPLIGLRGLFLLDATLCLTAALLVTFLVPEPPPGNRSRTVFGNVKGAAQTVWQRPALRWNFASWYLVRGAAQVVSSYLPVRLTELQPTNAAATIGLVLGVFGALTTAATWATGRIVDRVGAARLFWPAMMLAAGCVIGMALAPWLWVVAALAWLRAVPVALTNTVLYTHLAHILAREERAPVMTFTPVPRNLAAFTVPLVASAAANAGTSAALLVGAAVYGLASLAGWQLLTSTPPEANADEVQPTGEVTAVG